MSYKFKGKFSLKLNPKGKYNSRHVLYGKWGAMMRHCYDYMDRSYDRFGRMGIRVDRRWHDFDNFVDDVSPVPENKTLGRLRIDDHYGPDNFKWLDRTEAARQTKEITEWLKSTGVVDQLCA